jgi:TetR/AcrR family transcriptional repressor of bet genes
MATRAKLTQRTHAGIERALVRLLAAKPYDAISMTDIAKEADVAVRTVQRHFGSKDDVLAAAVRYPAQALSEELSKRPAGQSPREDLQSLVASLFAIYNRYRPEIWTLYNWSSEVPELMQALLMSGAAWMSAIEALMARWSHRCAIDPMLAKRAIMALSSYPTWRGFAGAGGFGSPEAETIVAKLLYDLIFEPTEAP